MWSQKFAGTWCRSSQFALASIAKRHTRPAIGNEYRGLSALMSMEYERSPGLPPRRTTVQKTPRQKI
jgi:hypothetical protein